MEQKPDLTLKKMRETLKFVTGDWPTDPTWTVTDNSFFCNSKSNKLTFESLEHLKKLGYEDVTIQPNGEGNFKYHFIWKKEKK